MKFLEGYPGKYDVIARRSGNHWYIAGINGDQNEKKVNFEVSSFKKSKATLFTGGATGKLFSSTVLGIRIVFCSMGKGIVKFKNFQYQPIK